MYNTDELIRCPQYSEFKSDCFNRQRQIGIPCALLIVDNTTKMSIGVSFPHTVKKNGARLERMRVLQTTSAMLFRNLLEHTKGCHPSRRRWRCHAWVLSRATYNTRVAMHTHTMVVNFQYRGSNNTDELCNTRYGMARKKGATLKARERKREATRLLFENVSTRNSLASFRNNTRTIGQENS